MEEKQTKDKTTVYIPPDVREALKVSARRNRRSFNAELLIALEYYLAQQEQKAK